MTVTIRDNQAILREIVKVSDSMVSVKFEANLEGVLLSFNLTASVTPAGQLVFNAGSGSANVKVNREQYRKLLDMALEAYSFPAVRDQVCRDLYTTSTLEVWVSKEHKSFYLEDMSTQMLINVLGKIKSGDAGYAKGLTMIQLTTMYHEVQRRGVSLTYNLSMLVQQHSDNKYAKRGEVTWGKSIKSK